jgi:hypothetical protein
MFADLQVSFSEKVTPRRDSMMGEAEIFLAAGRESFAALVSKTLTN